ncbi:fido domain-containing protein [Xylariaceae sp. FL1272]|nr:fido domain-containing protein [Xylariaceae sp. FL1272]
MPPSPRKSLHEVFPEFDIEHHHSIRARMKKGWPSQLSLRGTRESVNLTIKLADYLREETDYQVTDQLCSKVFRVEKVDAVVDERSKEYQDARNALLARSSNSPVTQQTVSRSRQEVINHACALNHAIDYFVLDSNAISESFLKVCHGISCEGVLDSDAGTGGEYRTWEIAARYGMKKKSQFIRAQAVPNYMADLVRDLEMDLIKAETSKELDLFDMASRYCHRFVCIHPFGDGNGRMCRILVNIILLKYGGHVSRFGGSDAERMEYLDLSQRANKKFHQEEMEMDEDDKTGHRELAELTLRKSMKALSTLWHWCVSKEHAPETPRDSPKNYGSTLVVRNDGVRGAVTRKSDKRDDRRTRFAAHFLRGPFAGHKSKKYHRDADTRSNYSSRSSSSSRGSRGFQRPQPPMSMPPGPFPGSPHHHPHPQHFGGPYPPPPPPPPPPQAMSGPPAGFEDGFIQLGGGGGGHNHHHHHEDPVWGTDAEYDGETEPEVWE